MSTPYRNMERHDGHDIHDTISSSNDKRTQLPPKQNKDRLPLSSPADQEQRTADPNPQNQDIPTILTEINGDDLEFLTICHFLTKEPSSYQEHTVRAG